MHQSKKSMRQERVRAIILIALCILMGLTLSLKLLISMKSAEKANELVPIEIGYARVEITNLQNTPNGTYIYILTDTATNREYLYVYRDGVAGCIAEIGDYIEPRIIENLETQNLIDRNELSHTGIYVAYEDGVRWEP